MVLKCIFFSTFIQTTDNFLGQSEAKKEERKKGRGRDPDRDTGDINRAVSEDEGGLVQKMLMTLLNNASVVSVSPGIRPPGVSQRPLSPVPRPSHGARDGGREDGHRALLSQPHPAAPTCRPGLPMSLYTPRSSLFTDRHAGNSTDRTDWDWCVW